MRPKAFRGLFASMAEKELPSRIGLLKTEIVLSSLTYFEKVAHNALTDLLSLDDDVKALILALHS